jgi:hypothetical protein
MEKLVSGFKKVAHWVAAAFAVAVWVVLVFLGLRKKKPGSEGNLTSDGVPPASPQTEDAVREAEKQAAVVKTEAAKGAAAVVEELRGTARVSDEEERLKRLAELARRK